MSKNRVLTAVVCAAFSAGLMAAQSADVAPTRPTPATMIAKQVTRYATLLNLDAGQQSKATAYITAEHNATAALRSGMRTAHMSLKTAIENNDAAGITAATTQIGTLTAQELQAHATAQAGFFSMLSPTQQATYKQLGPIGGMGGPEGMHHGFGGPGGPR
jgi:Spy/CpxP family protein refolding chaperone